MASRYPDAKKVVRHRRMAYRHARQITDEKPTVNLSHVHGTGATPLLSETIGAVPFAGSGKAAVSRDSGVSGLRCSTVSVGMSGTKSSADGRGIFVVAVLSGPGAAPAAWSSVTAGPFVIQSPATLPGGPRRAAAGN